MGYVFNTARPPGLVTDSKGLAPMYKIIRSDFEHKEADFSFWFKQEDWFFSSLSGRLDG